jgi:hypothetical protein
LTTSSAARRIEIPVRRKEYAWKPKTPGARLFPTSKFTKGKLNEARALCDKFVEKTREEAKVMFYGFTFDADHMHCGKAIRTRMVCSLALKTWESSSRRR